MGMERWWFGIILDDHRVFVRLQPLTLFDAIARSSSAFVVKDQQIAGRSFVSTKYRLWFQMYFSTP